MKQLNVYKGRTNIVPVSLGFDVSADTFTSQIREKPDRSSDLIATWDVTFDSDGVDGELILTMDDAVTNTIDQNVGYMDLKRTVGGEPMNVFEEPIQVVFQDTVTI